MSEPAFPFNGVTVISSPGLTKLEWFAGMAMTQLDQSMRMTITKEADKDNESPTKKAAKFCFNIAQAMLDESEKRDEVNIQKEATEQ